MKLWPFCCRPAKLPAVFNYPLSNIMSSIKCYMSIFILAIYAERHRVSYGHGKKWRDVVEEWLTEALTASSGRIMEWEHSLDTAECRSNEAADGTCKSKSLLPAFLFWRGGRYHQNKSRDAFFFRWFSVKVPISRDTSVTDVGQGLSAVPIGMGHVPRDVMQVPVRFSPISHLGEYKL